MKRTVATLAAVLSLALGGCAAAPSRPAADAPSEEARAAADAIDAVGTAAAGEAVRLPPLNPLRAALVYPLEPYAAASGRRCRPVALGRPDGARRVLCRRADGHWTATRSLSGASVRVPSARDASSDADRLRPAPRAATVPTGRPATRVTLAAGETLWAFAERTTGRGENWPAIARANGIVDPARVDAGVALTVPPALAAAR